MSSLAPERRLFERSWWLEAMELRVRGRLVVLGVLYLYFVDLIARGGHLAWGWFEVPAVSPSFLDLRSITSGWECTRRGIDVLALNPCDPQHRPANYPRLWMWPSHLGLGQSSTLILGLLLAVLFLGTAFAFMGRVATLLDALVWSAVIVSPVVMLGVERGNADLFVFVVVAAALGLFRSRDSALRGLSLALLLVAAILKLFPLFAFALIARLQRVWALIGGGLVALGFLAYALATLQDIRTIERVLPQQTYYSYGADVWVRAVTTWLAAHVGSLAFLAHPGTERLMRLACIAVAVAGAVVVARRWRAPAETATVGEVDAFVVGAVVFAGTFVLEHNFDYRLVFLLFAVPALLRWSRRSRLAALATATLLVVLWANEWLSGWYFAQRYPIPYDELANWLLFSLLAGMAAALTRPYWSRAALRSLVA